MNGLIMSFNRKSNKWEIFYKNNVKTFENFKGAFDYKESLLKIDWNK